MKKAIRIILPILLALAILACMVWYLFIYDREFTRDMLLQSARHFENKGNHAVASWFYDRAYDQTGDNDAVAIELANQHKAAGNYTKAEATLSKAIEDGGGVDVYIALCKAYAEQDKLLDCVNLLNNVTNAEIKAQLDAMRPAAPVAAPAPGFYNQYISVTVTAETGTLYVNPKAEYPSVTDAAYTAPIALVDGENTLYALTVAENGLVSPLAIFGYTVGGVIEEVSFADSNMERYIRELLQVNDNAILLSNDLWGITTLTLPEGTASFADLKYFPFLEELTITDCSAKDLSSLSSLANLVSLQITNTSVSADDLVVIGALPKLETLTLRGCGLSTTAGLEKATALRYLDLSNNAIRNISALSTLQSLQTVNLQNNALTDLSSLSSLTTITRLNISGNTVTSLSPICALTGMTWLDASRNKLTGLEQIGNLTALKELYLSKNALTSISPIGKCTNLEKLSIDNNQLTEISAVSQLKKLAILDFSFNQVTVLPNFDKSCALIAIDGSNNLLESLEQLGGLEHLNNVFMDYNEKISSLDPLVKCPLLIRVDVYGTAVTDISRLTEMNVNVNHTPIQPTDS